MRDLVKFFLFFHLFIWRVGGGEAENIPSVAEIDLELKDTIIEHGEKKKKSDYHSYSQEKKAQMEREFLKKTEKMTQKIQVNISAAQELAKKRIKVNGSLLSLKMNAVRLESKKRNFEAAWDDGNDSRLGLGKNCVRSQDEVTCESLNPETKNLLGIDLSDTQTISVSLHQINKGFADKGTSLTKEKEALERENDKQKIELKKTYGFKDMDFKNQRLSSIAKGELFSNNASTYLQYSSEAESRATLKILSLLERAGGVYETLFQAEGDFNKANVKVGESLETIKKFMLSKFNNSVVGSAITRQTFQIACMSQEQRNIYCDKRSLSGAISDFINNKPPHHPLQEEFPDSNRE